jgi:1-acyl-sn-glycerol-3-phosphate acyltransferase
LQEKAKMWNAITNEGMPDFWPPRPSRFWAAVLEPFRRFYLRRYYGIAEVVVEGFEECCQRFGPADGVLLAPNHSHDSDPHVMVEVGRRTRRRLYFMAAWQIFRTHWGIDGFLMQRMGAFSVDREGVDRRAIRQAVELLTGQATLVVFPEGEIYHLNERLTPLLEGVAFMAQSAQRDLDRNGSGGRVWIVPTAIRYSYVDDILPKLEAAMAQLEGRFMWKPPPGATLPDRIVRYGEVLLTIKEKEKLGRSCENDGDLPTRIARFIAALLEQMEKKYLNQSPAAETVPLRVKAVRRALLETWTDENAAAEARREARAALDDVQLVLQLYSYPGDYLAQKPSVERMAETIEKFEEDINGFARPKGRRRARIIFGEPIDLKEKVGTGRARAVAAEVTDHLEKSLQHLMSSR